MYGLVNAGQSTKQQAIGGIQNAARLEQSRNQQNDAIETQEKQTTIGATASGAAIGTAILPGVGTAVGAAAGLILGELI